MHLLTRLFTLHSLEKQRAELQEQISKTGSDLAAAQTTATADSKGIVEKNTELEGQVKKLQRELATLGERGEAMSRGKDEQERAYRKSARDLDEASKGWEVAKSDLVKKVRAKRRGPSRRRTTPPFSILSFNTTKCYLPQLELAQQKVHDTNKSSQQLKTQKDQMKKLWESSKKKAENLQEEVGELKKELAEVLGKGGK